MTQPIEIIGFKSIGRLKDMIARHGARGVTVFTGPHSWKLSGAKKIIDACTKKYTTIFCPATPPYPEWHEVERMAGRLKKTPGMVIALGGGRVLDSAKLANLLCGQRRFFVAVPTTSGSGSEATQFAVVYKNQIKNSVTDPKLLPDVALVDPALTLSLSPSVTAASGMDALSQAVESFWSANSTARSKRYATEAIRLILPNLKKAVRSPTRKNRAAMMKGSHLAGKAINLTKTTACHAVSYPMTAYYGISHGQAVAFTLPCFFIFNSEVTEKDSLDPRGARYVRRTLARLTKLFGCRSAEETSDRIRELMLDIGMKTRLCEAGIKSDADLRKLLSHVDLERIQNNPRRVTTAALCKMFRALMVCVPGKGRP